MIRKPSAIRICIYLALCLLTFACTPAPATPTSPGTSGTDVELDTAIRQARDSLDVFIAKITTPHPDRTFVALKVRFRPPDESPQDIWVDEVTYPNGVFRGNMGDDIPALKLEMGEKITIHEEDIVDWMIVEDGKLVGGYTIRLALQRMSSDERERFLETLDYSIEDRLSQLIPHSAASTCTASAPAESIASESSFVHTPPAPIMGNPNFATE
jgi:uncharacterized protein YegJ (DUF2314 family)